THPPVPAQARRTQRRSVQSLSAPTARSGLWFRFRPWRRVPPWPRAQGTTTRESPVSMVQSLRSLFARPTALRRPRPNRPAPLYRPAVEGREHRRALSPAAPLAPPAFAAAFAAPAAQQLTSMIPLSITGVSVQNGQLVAQVLLGGQSFTAPLI